MISFCKLVAIRNSSDVVLAVVTNVMRIADKAQNPVTRGDKHGRSIVRVSFFVQRETRVVAEGREAIKAKMRLRVEDGDWREV